MQKRGTKAHLWVLGLVLYSLLVALATTSVFSTMQDEDLTPPVKETDEGVSKPSPNPVSQSKFQASLTPSEFSIDVESDIMLSGDSINIFSGDIDITLVNQSKIFVSSFRGEIKKNTDSIILQGTLSYFKSDHSNIIWQSGSRATITILNGSVSVHSTYLKSFSNTANGVIKVNDKVDISLDKDTIELNKYKGSIAYDASNVLRLDGTVEKLKVNSNDYLFSAN